MLSKFQGDRSTPSESKLLCFTNNFISQPLLQQNSQPNGSPAKFSLGDRVRWFRVPTQDFGLVCECFYGLESSVQAVGWHYSIQLDPNSPSFAHCKMDYGL